MRRSSKPRTTLRRLAPALLLLIVSGCSDSWSNPFAPDLPDPPAASPHEDQALFLDAARAAWTYADREYQPATGLVNSVADYPYTTAWDIGSSLAALYAAGELDLLTGADYDLRMRRALRTLGEMRLFEGTAFNRNYSTLTGELVGRDGDVGVSQRGTGWSATDLGRLLVWLKIISENQPRHAADVQRIVDRIDFEALIDAGYLRGAALQPGGEVQRFQEGRVGYEQYAAHGFALWGHRAEKALRLHENTLPIRILDVDLVADTRGNEHLTSEPFVLAGLELGWSEPMASLSRRVLEVQEARYEATGQVTVMSEDAVPVPPHYFYYYLLNHHGTPFAVVSPVSHEVLDWPRWVSAKAAFGWHALLPRGYTRLALLSVALARDPLRGWGAGVYEGTGAPTGGYNLNTAAVILEAALFSRSRRPLIFGG